MRKEKLWKGILVVFTCTVLALSAPPAYAAEDVSAQEESGNEFQIENGVLIKYTGNAREVTVPEGVTSIGYNAFNARFLESVTLPESVTSIEEQAFFGSALRSITMSEGVISIGKRAFSGCTRLTSITLPESITSIGDQAFQSCFGLTSITLPKGVTSIGMNTFVDCTSLTSITLPEGVTSIGGSAFARCTSLTSITLPESLTSIGGSAFSGCKGLTSITLPESVTSIGPSAFSGCSSLTSITLPKSITSIEYWTFYGCSSLASITLPEGITSIGAMAFSGCTSLTSIALPKSVTTIEGSAFSGCFGLTNVTLPEGITTIKEELFVQSGLTSITLPESVTSIEMSAFAACRSLTSITLPEGVTSIGDWAFSDCESLTSITLPESITNIGENAFLGSDSLTIYCKEGSYAQQYAAENELKYEFIKETQPEIPSETPNNEIILTSENTSIKNSEMQNYVNINQTQDIIVKSTDGVKFTFPKGTMKMIDGKESYDLGVKLITDYTQAAVSLFAEDEFVFRINYSYKGNLPSENTSISIPVDKKWIGQTLYYYRIEDNGEYTYLTSAVVGDDGMYTIIQGHCSDYVATLKALEKTPAETEKPAGKEDNPKTGDIDISLYIALCIAGLTGVFAAGYKKSAR